MEDNTKVKIGLILILYSAVSVPLSMIYGYIWLLGVLLFLTGFFSGFIGLISLYKGLPKIGQGVMLIGFGVFLTIISLLLIFAVNSEADIIVAFSLMIILLWTLALFIPGALLVRNVDISRGFKLVDAFFAMTIFLMLIFIFLYAIITQISFRDTFYEVFWGSLATGIIVSLAGTIYAYFQEK